jgi:hypothetical protein
MEKNSLSSSECMFQEETMMIAVETVLLSR